MSQHLNIAIESISHEIERLTDLREQLSRMNDESGALSTSSLVPKSPSKKSAGTKTAAKRSGRPPVSEETRQKMADARRAFFANKTIGSNKTATTKVATKKSASKKSTAKKKTAPAKSEAEV